MWQTYRCFAMTPGLPQIIRRINDLEIELESFIGLDDFRQLLEREEGAVNHNPAVVGEVFQNFMAVFLHSRSCQAGCSLCDLFLSVVKSNPTTSLTSRLVIVHHSRRSASLSFRHVFRRIPPRTSSKKSFANSRRCNMTSVVYLETHLSHLSRSGNSSIVSGESRFGCHTYPRFVAGSLNAGACRCLGLARRVRGRRVPRVTPPTTATQRCPAADPVWASQGYSGAVVATRSVA